MNSSRKDRMQVHGLSRQQGALNARPRHDERRRSALWTTMVAVLVTQFNSGAWAQVAGRQDNSKDPIRKDLGKLTINAEMVQKATKGARKFKAFTAQEVAADTGEKVDDSTMVQLKDGSKITMKEALSQINKLEEKLNKEGLSLRDKGARIKVASLKPDTARIARQKAAIDSAIIPEASVDAPVRIAKGKVARSATELKAISSNIKSAPTVTSGLSQTVSQHKEWRKDYGDSDIMSVYIAAEVDIKGSSESTEVGAEAVAGGAVFGKDLEVIKASGAFKAPSSGTQSVKLDLELAGKTVLSLDKSYESWSKSQSWSKAVEAKGEVVLPIVGPLVAKASVGVEGAAAIGYEASLATLYAGGMLSANTEVKGFAEVSVSLDIAVAEIDAGFGGELTFIDAELEVMGRIQANIASSTPSLDYEAYAYANLTLLEGELYVFIELDVPWPFNKYDKRWEFDLVDWTGYQKKAFLFSIPETSLTLAKK